MNNILILSVISTLLASVANAEPLFVNSIVSTDIDFITDEDPAIESCVQFVETSEMEMPGQESGELMADGVFVYQANFQDGTQVQVWAHPDISNKVVREAEVEHIAQRLAKLPSFMRETLDHVVLNKGDNTAFAEHEGNFLVVTDGNMRTRRENHDMEETLFHESVHATMDLLYRDNDPDWSSAQAKDNDFVTRYAEEIVSEDLAETAIFAFVEKYYPNRLPEEVSEKLYNIIPNKMEYVMNILPEKEQYFTNLRTAKLCN